MAAMERAGWSGGSTLRCSLARFAVRLLEAFQRMKAGPLPHGLHGAIGPERRVPGPSPELSFSTLPPTRVAAATSAAFAYSQGMPVVTGPAPKTPGASRAKPDARENTASAAAKTARASPAVRRASCLPGLLQEIADATDVRTALAIARAKGGQTAYFAPRPAADSWLAKLVGLDAARKIGRALVGSVGADLLLPSAKHELHRLLIAEGLDEGLSHRALGLRLGFHVRTIQRHAKQLAMEHRAPRGGTGDRK